MNLIIIFIIFNYFISIKLFFIHYISIFIFLFLFHLIIFYIILLKFIIIFFLFLIIFSIILFSLLNYYNFFIILICYSHLSITIYLFSILYQILITLSVCARKASYKNYRIQVELLCILFYFYLQEKD
jgi:hypothetical protein